MEWTQSDSDALLNFTTAIDSDDIHIKEKIKKILLNNRFIIHVLNNEELEEQGCEPDDYFNVNILPYFLIEPIQTDVKNYVCYEIHYNQNRGQRINDSYKRLQIIFHILCHNKSLIDEDTEVARHDLLAALIQNDFDFSVDFGSRIRLVSDVASTADKNRNYACRTLTFEQVTDNNVVKVMNPRENDVSVRFANKDVNMDRHREWLNK